MDLSDATLAIGGMLTMPDNPILAQTFLFPPGTFARYLRFNVLDIAPGPTQGVGLNEIQVFGTPQCVSPPLGLVSWWPGDLKLE